jgi:hypothetical protein
VILDCSPDLPYLFSLFVESVFADQWLFSSLAPRHMERGLFAAMVLSAGRRFPRLVCAENANTLKGEHAGSAITSNHEMQTLQ